MQFKVISLDRSAGRFTRFLNWNPGLDVERFSGFDGAMLSFDECIRDGLITADNEYVAGALGAALSHVDLWRQCAQGGQSFHIAEDDVILRADFCRQADEVLKQVADWDVILWSFNFDWPVLINPIRNIASALMNYRWLQNTINVDEFRVSGGSTLLVPLVSAAGISCYSISPKGARAMLSDCLPIGSQKAQYMGDPKTGWNNTGLDVEMSRHYAKRACFVTIPPLALTPNDHTTSTIRGNLM